MLADPPRPADYTEQVVEGQRPLAAFHPSKYFMPVWATTFTCTDYKPTNDARGVALKQSLNKIHKPVSI